MNEPPEGDEKTASVRNVFIDLARTDVEQCNRLLHELTNEVESVEITGCRGEDMIAVGLRCEVQLRMMGDIGDYCLVGLANAEAEVKGNAGCGLGEAMDSGLILVRGNSKDATGAFNRGGSIVVDGSAGRRTGLRMHGGDIAVKGSVGSQAAMGMIEGTLLVLGSAGPQLGHAMQGGTIYTGGEVTSIAPHLEEVRFKDADRLRVSLLFLKAGVENENRPLRVWRVAPS